MEQNSLTRTVPGDRSFSILEGQLRECYGRVVYTHKTHEKCADILLDKQSRIKGIQIALSAITTAGFVGAVFGAGPIAAGIGTLISAALLALNAYTKDSDLGELAQIHRQSANQIRSVREAYLSLLVDLSTGREGHPELIARRDALAERLDKVLEGAPSTNGKAYGKAQEALKKSEDMTFSDAEIDAFLPGELKRSKPNSAMVAPGLESGDRNR